MFPSRTSMRGGNEVIHAKMSTLRLFGWHDRLPPKPPSADKARLQPWAELLIEVVLLQLWIHRRRGAHRCQDGGIRLQRTQHRREALAEVIQGKAAADLDVSVSWVAPHGPKQRRSHGLRRQGSPGDRALPHVQQVPQRVRGIARNVRVGASGVDPFSRVIGRSMSSAFGSVCCLQIDLNSN